MTHSADQFEELLAALIHSLTPPPLSLFSHHLLLLHLRLSSAHAHHCYRSAVSACSAAARSFSPLCFTDSGFNSDSTQYPADCAAPEQVSSSNYSCPPSCSVLGGSAAGLRSRFVPPPPHLSHVSFRLVLRGMLYVLFYVSMRWCMAAPGPAVAHRGWGVF